VQAEVIRIGQWNRDEEFAVHPVGSKPKRMLTCPLQPGQEGLIPGHSYLFKTAADWRIHQIWSEAIAYQLGTLVGLNVPRCFIAEDETTGELGALIEFFFGYPGEQVTWRLAHGSDLLNLFGKDRTSDRPHSARTNIRLCRMLGVTDAPTWWGEVFTFDALIGNTDRHPENWGFLLATTPEGGGSVEMAPVYDNGTSFGYEIQQQRLGNMRDVALHRYVERGTHHCGWDDADGGSIQFAALCGRLAQSHPEALQAMRRVLEFTDEQLEAVLNQCTTLQVESMFTPERAEFVARLVKARKACLLAEFGGD